MEPTKFLRAKHIAAFSLFTSTDTFTDQPQHEDNWKVKSGFVAMQCSAGKPLDHPTRSPIQTPLKFKNTISGTMPPDTAQHLIRNVALSNNHCTQRIRCQHIGVRRGGQKLAMKPVRHCVPGKRWSTDRRKCRFCWHSDPLTMDHFCLKGYQSGGSHHDSGISTNPRLNTRVTTDSWMRPAPSVNCHETTFVVVQKIKIDGVTERPGEHVRAATLDV